MRSSELQRLQVKNLKNNLQSPSAPAADAAVYLHRSLKPLVRQSRPEPQALVNAPTAHTHLVHCTLKLQFQNGLDQDM